MKLNRYSEFPIITACNVSRSKRKAVYGIGNNDANYKVSPIVNGVQVRCPISELWMKMFVDCYSPSNKSKRPENSQRSVCSSWKSFNNFREWVLSHDESEWWNKVLKNNGEVYSPSTCFFAEKGTRRPRTLGKNINPTGKSETIKSLTEKLDTILGNEILNLVSDLNSAESVEKAKKYTEVKYLILKANKVLNNV